MENNGVETEPSDEELIAEYIMLHAKIIEGDNESKEKNQIEELPIPQNNSKIIIEGQGDEEGQNVQELISFDEIYEKCGGNNLMQWLLEEKERVEEQEKPAGIWKKQRIATTIERIRTISDRLLRKILERSLNKITLENITNQKKQLEVIYTKEEKNRGDESGFTH